MNNTFERKEKTKIQIINSGAEKRRGNIWQNFATAAAAKNRKK